MPIISTSRGKNPLEEVEWSYSSKRVQMLYLGAISKMIE